MVCSGVVKQGRVELEPGANLPEGSRVRVELVTESATASLPQTASGTPESFAEMTGEQWREAWRKLADEVSKSWNTPKSALEVLSEMRR